MINADDYLHIKGWGVDSDPENDPTFPIRLREENELKGLNWERPAQQVVNLEILHSNERPNVSAVFGTSSPPAGLSGIIRRYAFKHSENEYLHWLPLLLADRIQVVEGIFSDLIHGQFPNIYKETGGKATWKYNKKKIVQKALIAGVVATFVGVLIYEKQKQRAKNK